MEMQQTPRRFLRDAVPFKYGCIAVLRQAEQQCVHRTPLIVLWRPLLAGRRRPDSSRTIMRGVAYAIMTQFPADAVDGNTVQALSNYTLTA